MGRIGEGQAGANAGFAGGRGCGKLDGDVVIWLGGTPGIEAYRREKKTAFLGRSTVGWMCGRRGRRGIQLCEDRIVPVHRFGGWHEGLCDAHVQ